MQKRLSFQRITSRNGVNSTRLQKTAQMTEIINANKSGSIAHCDIRTGNELSLFDKAPGTAGSGHFTSDVSPDFTTGYSANVNRYRTCQ